MAQSNSVVTPAPGKAGAGLAATPEVPLLINGVNKELFLAEETKLNQLLWRTESESEYPHLLKTGTEQDGDDAFPENEAGTESEDLVDLGQWRIRKDSYFIECYQKALKLKWTRVMALSKKYGLLCKSCPAGETSVKQGVYDAIMGLLKLKAKVNSEGNGFDIDMMGRFRQDDLELANMHFARARVCGFPYGGYLFMLTSAYRNRTGYWLRTHYGKEQVIEDFDDQKFFADAVPLLVESAIAGSRQAVLDLVMLFNLQSYQPGTHRNAGLVALILKWHLVTPYLHQLTFNVRNIGLSGYVADFFFRLNDPVLGHHCFRSCFLCG